MVRKAFAVLLALATGLGVVVVATAMPTGLVYYAEPDYWQDLHQGYPIAPCGLSPIKKTFGEPCNADARVNTYTWVAADDHRPYPVHFHRLLGGTASSNLDNDIPGHIEQKQLGSAMLAGIWGYNCRLKRNSSEYSAHAWGIAVDINSAHEAQGQSCHTVPDELGAIWTSHKWRWGKAWGDCMHFQYASGY